MITWPLLISLKLIPINMENKNISLKLLRQGNSYYSPNIISIAFAIYNGWVTWSNWLLMAKSYNFLILLISHNHLVIYRCVKLTDGGLQKILIKCSSLRSLNLYALSGYIMMSQYLCIIFSLSIRISNLLDWLYFWSPASLMKHTRRSLFYPISGS